MTSSTLKQQLEEFYRIPGTSQAFKDFCKDESPEILEKIVKNFMPVNHYNDSRKFLWNLCTDNFTEMIMEGGVSVSGRWRKFNDIHQNKEYSQTLVVFKDFCKFVEYYYPEKLI